VVQWRKRINQNGVTHGPSAGLSLVVQLREKLRAERTNLLPKILEAWEEIPEALQEMQGSNPLYGYIGADDYTSIPSSAQVQSCRSINDRKGFLLWNWHTDHDRPVFFVELHEKYICCWCEMHSGQLILIPSQQSQRRTQHVRYPTDATIIGRVTAVAMTLIEAQSE
jgi:hypothetical protein